MRVITVLEIFRETYRDIAAPTIETFFRIAAAGERGLLMKDLERTTGMSQSAISRHVQLLSAKTWRRPRQPRADGLGLVVTREDPTDARRKIAYLTERGQEMWDYLTEIMQGKLTAESLG